MSTPNEAASDRRDTKRRHLIYNIAVLDVHSGEEVGRLADISVDGLMIASPAQHPLLVRCLLTFKLPQNCQHFHNVEFEAEARWHASDANPDYELTGYHVLAPSAEYERLAYLLMHEIGFKD